MSLSAILLIILILPILMVLSMVVVAIMVLLMLMLLLMVWLLNNISENRRDTAIRLDFRCNFNINTSRAASH
jgi:hypothetical protein